MDNRISAVTRALESYGTILFRFALAAAGIVLVLAVHASAARQVVVDGTGNTSSVKFAGTGLVQRGDRTKQYRPGEVLVRFKPAANETARLKIHRRMNAELIRSHKKLDLHHVRLKQGMTVAEAVSRYQGDPDVEYAEPNYLVSIQNTPNDPQFSQQWGLARINAPAAWDLTTGSNSAVVAILDTGMDYRHPDLIDNLWVNQPELNGQSGNDDDGNGYIDDIHGYNTVTNNGDPMDDHFHGTHVAGIIGAVGNNAEGVAGVAWNVKLMACKFLDAGGTGTIADAIECLQYVKTMKNRGVNIVATNNSWGSPSYSQALYDAIRDQKDILFVAGTGNDNSKIPHYPASYDLPNIISVAASDESDQMAAFSGFNQWDVDIAAPGNNILSTFPGAGYAAFSGTSMATAHVSGLAALLNSQDTNRTTPNLKNLILAGGDPLSSFSDVTVSGRRINAYNSLVCTSSPLLAVLHLPQTPQSAVPQTLSAMSINCGAAVGPVSVTLADGQSIQLLDDGVAPDLVAGDGIFTGTWTPTGSSVETLTFRSPLGTRSVSSPPVTIGEPPTVPSSAMLLPNAVSSANINTMFSQTFPLSGGVPPFSWSLVKGSLPAGLTLDSNSGELSGTPADAGVYPLTLQVSDSLGVKDRKKWTLLLNDGLRFGWPRELRQRAGSGYLPESYSPVMADLDGNGRDAIIVSDVDSLYVFHPDGTSRKTVLPGKVTTPVVADLDGDGHKEIIVSVREYYSSSNSIYAFHSDLSPLAGFPAGAYSSYNGGPGFVSSPVVADFNNDGQLRIAVVASPNNVNDPNYDKNVVIMVDGQGQMVPGWPQVFGNYNEDDSPPAIGDIDRDGKQELVFATSDGYIRIFGHDGTALAQWQFDPNVITSWSPVLADMNGKGFADIVVKYQNSSNPNIITVFDHNGALLSGWPRILSGTSATPFGPVVADIDGDGRPEIITVSGGYRNELQALRGDGSSLPNWPVIIPTAALGAPYFNCYPVVADINGDGRQEVLVTTVDSSNNGRLLAYGADGTLLSGFPKYVSPASDIRSSAAIGDVDGNGKLDLAVKSENGFLYVWEMPQDAGVKDLQWPMFRNDERHSGAWLPSRPGLTPMKYDFQNVLVGSKSTPQPFTISNPRSMNVVISSISITGSDNSMFFVTQGSCGSLPVSLSPLQSCTVEVTFAPTSAGVKVSELTVATSTPGMVSSQAALSGRGVVPAYTLVYSQSGSGNGLITSSTGTSYSGSGTETIPAGTVVTLTPTPAVDSFFSGWSGCDSVASEVCTLIMSSDRNVSGTFSAKSYRITVTAGANGSISGPATANYGASASYTITPAAGFRVADVVVDGVSVGAVTSYSFSNITANHTISATFSALADLTVTSIRAPKSAVKGKSITVGASISNRGGSDATSFTVAFYLSKDNVINNRDMLLGTKTVTFLKAGSCTQARGSFTVPRGISSGRYHVGVIVDSGDAIVESNESNNSMASGSTTTIK